MALDKSKVKGTATAPTAAGKAPSAQNASNKKADNETIIKMGNELVSSMSEEQKAALGSKSNTLHFRHLLGLQSKKSTRKVSKTDVADCSTPVGIVFVSDEPIEVPDIDIKYNQTTGVPAEAYKTRKVAAGEEFAVSYIELMFLLTRDEYAGNAEANGESDGVQFSPKPANYFSGKQKLPTPTLRAKAGTGSIKENMVDIDEQVDGKWQVVEKYREKFGPLLAKRAPQRGGSKPRGSQTKFVAAAIQDILKKSMQQPNA